MTATGSATAATGGVLVMNSSKNKNDGYERGKGNTSSGNKNMKYANPKAREAAAQKYAEAKQKLKDAKNKAHRTTEDKKIIEKIKTEIKHWKLKMDFTGENHSQTGK